MVVMVVVLRLRWLRPRGRCGEGRCVLRLIVPQGLGGGGIESRLLLVGPGVEVEAGALGGVGVGEEGGEGSWGGVGRGRGREGGEGGVEHAEERHEGNVATVFLIVFRGSFFVGWIRGWMDMFQRKPA